jgi:hypothetical protein
MHCKLLFRGEVKRFAVFLLVLFHLAGCKKDDFSKLEPTEWTPEFAFPIVYSDLGIEDLIAEKDSGTIVSSDANDVVEIIYQSFNQSKFARELLSLPEINNSGSLSLDPTLIAAFNANPSPGTLFNEQVNLNYPFSLDASLEAASQLDSLIFKSGNLEIRLNSTVPQPCTVLVRIPQLRLNNNVFERELVFTGNSLPELQISVSNLDGYTLQTPGESFSVQFDVQVLRSGSGAIPNADAFTFDFLIQSPQFNVVYGYFQGLQMPVQQNDSLEIGLFRNAIDAVELNFLTAKARISTFNSSGIPFQTQVTLFEGIRPGFTIPQVPQSDYNATTLLGAMATPQSPPASTSVELLSGSTNIAQVVNALPRAFATAAIANPQLSPGQGQFLLDTSRIGVKSELTLPLSGLTLKLRLVDTLDFDFQGITDDIIEGMLRLNTLNGFPTESAVQIYFCRKEINENGVLTGLTRLDSLFSDGQTLVLGAGSTAANGITTPTSEINDTYLTAAQWKALSTNGANCLQVKAQFTTFNQAQDIVKVFESNRLLVRIAARVKFRQTIQ